MEDDLNSLSLSTFLKMEDNLHFFKNEKQPKVSGKWKTTPIFSKWKTPFFSSKIKDELNFFFKKENYLNV
jgi:hypothetical protein